MSRKSKMIENILGSFDFKKVHKSMIRLEWKWVTPSVNGRVPKVKEIRKQAKWLLKSLKIGELNEHYSGGLCVRSFKGNGNYWIFELSFDIASYGDACEYKK